MTTPINTPETLTYQFLVVFLACCMIQIRGVLAECKFVIAQE